MKKKKAKSRIEIVEERLRLSFPEAHIQYVPQEDSLSFVLNRTQCILTSIPQDNSLEQLSLSFSTHSNPRVVAQITFISNVFFESVSFEMNFHVTDTGEMLEVMDKSEMPPDGYNLN